MTQTKPVMMAMPSKAIHTFDEAIALTGSGRFHWLLLFAVGFGLLAVVAEGMSMGYVLPLAKCELAISNVEQGMINAVAFIGVVVTSHFWGFMADTWGRVKVLRTSLLAGFVCSAISSFSTTSTMLLIFRLFVGLSVSGVQAASISYLGEFHSALRRTRWVTLGVMFMPMAVMYQPAVGLILLPLDWQFEVFGIEYGTWRIFILCTSSLMALTFVATMFMPESPKFLMAMGKQTEAVDVLRLVFQANGAGNAKDYPVREIAAESLGSSLADAKGLSGTLKLLWNQTHPVFRPPYVGNLLMLFFISIACYVASHGIFMWTPQILTFYLPRMHESITVCQAVQEGIAEIIFKAQSLQNSTMVLQETCMPDSNDLLGYAIIIAMGVVFFVFYMLAVFVKLPMKLMLTIWIMICALSGIAIIWTNNFYLSIVLITIMMSSGNCGGILSAIAADLFPTHFKSMALCLVFMFGRIGAVIGSNIVAVLLESYCDWIFVVDSILLFVSGTVCFALIQRWEQRQSQ